MTISPSHILAQINIARARAPADSALMQPFVAALDEISTLPKAAPGFVRCFKTGDGNVTSVVAYPDALIIVNMSVWQDPASRRDYSYKSMPVDFFRRRDERFEKMAAPRLAKRWIPAGTFPTVEEGRQRFASLAQNGSTEAAFTFGRAYPAPA
ncbi:MAG: DUF3291 domain-containing protein [Undibacterium sp.]|nr:DUF3291 domain-containing protein [Opitutaceae bacterium]